jgi:hypothetical protein
MNKQELTKKILDSRKQLDAAVAQISDERMSLVILHGEWSVRDLIGHLGFWENWGASLFATLRAGGTPESIQDMDAINAQALSEMRTLSLANVRRLEKSAYQKVLALLNEASDAELFEPDHFAWTQGRSFGELISDITWAHYDEHFPELLAWLKRIA